MTVKDKQVLEDMQKKIERLSVELKEFELKKQQADGFEKLDTDHFLTEVYN
ncbi:hypothetical protein [Desertibacillus haloalkaliphilus]|uniref:hypothetical protein n=1 Tax=Desertibacillus haloalkaliphilus TaxID=1328930 RepID=UPI001C2789E5|nr:hypothetical protein [Desertibacillus haloalkaliphilus]MBU8908904.1 hypothetical protein [Desertibacillus haloalkaliphilus]